jgi:hypothetical protein
MPGSLFFGGGYFGQYTNLAQQVRGRISWAQAEAPLVATRGRLSWTGLQHTVLTRGRISWADGEAPFVVTRGRISWAESEAPRHPARGRISWSSVRLASSPTRGRISWTVLLQAAVPTVTPLDPTQLHYAAPVYFVQIDVTVPEALTLRFSDRYIPAATDFAECLPLVLEWGEISDRLSLLDGGGAPSTFELALTNTRPVAGHASFSSLLAANTIEAAKVTVYRYDALFGLDTLETIWAGYIEEATELDDRIVRLRASDVTLLLENALPITVINKTDFVDATGAAIGKPIPRPVGVQKGVQAIPIVDGAVTTLRADMTTTQTSVPVADSAEFPTSGTVQIGTEQITYTGKTSTSLTGATRGASSTPVDEHNTGDTVMRLRGSYKLVVGEGTTDFPVSDISNIRVRGVKPRTSPTVNLAETVGSRKLATITFTVSSAKNFHTFPLGNPVTVAVAALSFPVLNGGASGVNIVRTVSVPTSMEMGKHTRRLRYRITRGGNTVGTVNWQVQRRLAGGTFATVAQGLSASNQASGTIFSATDDAEYMSFAAEEIKLIITYNNTNDGSFNLVVDEYSFRPVQSFGVSGDSTVGIVLGEVTCDVSGVKDDGAGTISGTPSLLLENPADVVAWLLSLYPYAITRAGWSTSRSALSGYKWAFLLGRDRAPRFSELRRLIGDQSKSRLTIERGEARLAVFPSSPSTDLELEYARDLWAEQAAAAQFTSRTQVITKLVVTDGKGDVTNVGSGAIEGQLELPWVTDASTVSALGTFWANWLGRVRALLATVGYQKLLPLRKGQVVELDTHPVLGPFTGLVLEKHYLLGDDNPDRIRIVAVDPT